MTIWEDIKWQYTYGSTLVRLILVNIGVFLVVNLINLPFLLFAKHAPFNLIDFLSLYAAPYNLVRHPWGIITYMFLHEGIWHILWNMIGLYWFGQIIQDLIGKAKILPLYIFGGIFGGVLYVLAYNIFPAFDATVLLSNCIGASASVMAIVLAAATVSPDYELRFAIFGNIKIKWIVLAYVLLDLINIQGSNPGGHIAHLGGALFGFTYIRLLQQGKDLARPFYVISDFFTSLFTNQSNLKVKYKKEHAYSTDKEQQPNSSSSSNTIRKQERLNKILDKINQSSYDSLTKEEKEFLFKISQED